MNRRNFFKTSAAAIFVSLSTFNAPLRISTDEKKETGSSEGLDYTPSNETFVNSITLPAYGTVVVPIPQQQIAITNPYPVEAIARFSNDQGFISVNVEAQEIIKL